MVVVGASQFATSYFQIGVTVMKFAFKALNFIIKSEIDNDETECL